MKSKIDKKATRSIAALGQALFTRCPFDHPEGRNKENLGQLLHHKTLPTLASRGIEDRKAQSSGACSLVKVCAQMLLRIITAQSKADSCS